MKTSTKQRLTKAGFNKTVFKRWSNLVIGLLSFIGILALRLFSFSFSFRDSVLEIIASDISYFQYGSYENLIKEVRNMDIDHPQTLEYDKEILIPQSK